jgi:hypothetical protein
MQLMPHPIEKGDAALALAEAAKFEREQVFRAWAQHLTVLARLLVSNKRYAKAIEVVPADLSGAPAATNGIGIYIDNDAIEAVFNPEDRAAATLVLKALVDHEIGHCVFTPTGQSAKAKKLREALAANPSHRTAFNMLEDQRIENLLIQRWPTMLHGLRVLIERGIIGRLDPDLGSGQLRRAWPLVSSRLTASHEVRDLVERAARHGGLSGKAFGPWTDAVKAISDEYVTLVLPRDVDRALALVTTYAELIGEVDDPMDAGGHNDLTGPAGNQVPEKEQDEAAKGVGKALAQDRQEDEGDGEGEGAGGETADGEAKDGDAGAGAGDGDGADPPTLDDLKAAVENNVAEAVEAKADEISEMRQAVKAIKERGVGRGDVGYAKRQDQPVGSHLVAVANRIRRVIEHERRQVESGWKRRTSSGKLNVRRYVAQEGSGRDLWDRWNDGADDATSIETVVLADYSSSMYRACKPTGEALWAIKRAHDLVGAPCTVLQFQHGVFSSVFKRTERADPRMAKLPSPGGGTNPLLALRQTHQVLAKSDAGIKLVVILTDGCWDGAGESEALIGMLRHAGVVVLLVGLDKAVHFFGTHNCTWALDLDRVSDLPDLVSKALRSEIRGKGK